MKTIIFFIFLFVDFCFGQKLIQANILWRHGDRAPLTSYSTDLVAEKEWGVHFGELTPLGLEQSFTKGLIIRQRYVRDLKLISPIYDSKQIFVRSTNVDRTLLSASAVLDGIYYDGEVEVPINSIHPLPAKTVNVPVHTVDYDTDYLLNVERICPKALQLSRIRNENPKFLDYIKKIQPIFEIVRNGTGFPIPTVFELRLMEDALLIEKNNNKPLPGWVTDQLLEKLDQILNDTDDYETGYPGFGLPMDFELIKIRSGPLLKEIIQNMQTAKNQKNDFKKINFYSAHDVTISSFLKTLEAKTQIIGGLLPNYTATVAVELWQASNVDSNFIQESDDFLVQVLYSANPTDDFHPVTRFIPGCPEDQDFCPFDVFVNRSGPFIPEDIIQCCYHF